MKKLILALAATFACLMAMPAAAALPGGGGNVRFSITGDEGTLTWFMPQSPTPDYADDFTFDVDGPFFVDGGDSPFGHIDGFIGNFTFFVEALDGGFTADFVLFAEDIPFPFGGSFNLGGAQLFDGDPSSPTFRLGTYDLFSLDDEPCGCEAFGAFAPGQYTLTIGAAVPEPAMWAVMIVGFGAAGAMIRRRKLVAA